MTTGAPSLFRFGEDRLATNGAGECRAERDGIVEVIVADDGPGVPIGTRLLPDQHLPR